ncbi:MAG: DUF5615 family PIN-like protein [Candidatus Rokubacteria bacterium]|nr:DUF5615 family PIN-like protein [Candidatus Rokubacteria bacterium]
MTLPLYLDADVHPIIARILRARGLDVISANEAGKLRATDREQLDFAVAQGRALFTLQRVRLRPRGAGSRSGRARPTRVLAAYSETEMTNRFVWLQSFK